MINLTSLVIKIFKARHFLEINFMGAFLISNPNFVWRSVLEARNLLREGLRKWIGVDLTVNILVDPWLPTERNLYISSNLKNVWHITI